MSPAEHEAATLLEEIERAATNPPTLRFLTDEGHEFITTKIGRSLRLEAVNEGSGIMVDLDAPGNWKGLVNNLVAVINE